MCGKEIEEFNKERETLNELVMKYSGTNIKRFYNLDSAVYNDGALPKKTKELIGLISSLVLRCDDCVKYHLDQCRSEGINSAELEEALAIGLIVGGSIIIPHLRKAIKCWDELVDEGEGDE
jgi:AhpD family alkylhydroperoxidase